MILVVLVVLVVLGSCDEEALIRFMEFMDHSDIADDCPHPSRSNRNRSGLSRAE